MREAKPIEYRISPNGCWVCYSHRPDADGYPQVWRDGRYYRVHRYSYEQNKGSIPDGMVIRHICDNRKCMNPNHLLVGTHADNVADRVARKRSAVGASNGRSKLTPDQVLEIFRDRYSKKMHLARQYGVDPRVIRDIQKGRKWQSVTRNGM